MTLAAPWPLPTLGSRAGTRLGSESLTMHTNTHTQRVILVDDIIATGGTFDKHYNELNGTLAFADSHLPQAIAQSRMTVGAALEQLPLLDSLDMQDADRERVLAACRAAGIPVEIVPGITAALGAAARIEASLTHRDHARRLQFITAHARDGKLPMDLDWSAI
eukprot:gene39305-62964_t